MYKGDIGKQFTDIQKWKGKSIDNVKRLGRITQWWNAINKIKIK